MIEAICAFGFMSAVTVAVQAARVKRYREPLEVSQDDPEANNIILLFAEADRMNKAA